MSGFRQSSIHHKRRLRVHIGRNCCSARHTLQRQTRRSSPQYRWDRCCSMYLRVQICRTRMVFQRFPWYTRPRMAMTIMVIKAIVDIKKATFVIIGIFCWRLGVHIQFTHDLRQLVGSFVSWFLPPRIGCQPI